MPKHSMLVYILQNCLLFQLEYMCHQVWTVVRCLPWKKLTFDFFPIRIASDCQKNVHLEEVVSNCHRILKLLLHVSWPTNVGRGENDSLAKVMKINLIITESNSIFKSTIQRCPQTWLVLEKKLKTVLINDCIYIHQKVLKEMSTP